MNTHHHTLHQYVTTNYYHFLYVHAKNHMYLEMLYLMLLNRHLPDQFTAVGRSVKLSACPENFVTGEP